MRRAVFGGAAMKEAGLGQVDRDARRDTAERLAQPTTPAMVSSFMQFCSETT